MRVILSFNGIYLILELLVLYIVSKALPADFNLIWQQVGYYVWTDVILLFVQIVGSFYAIFGLFYRPKSHQLTLLSYLPILLFFEGGPLSLMGIFLMIIGTYMKFRAWKVIV